jgi:hypothetical protein
MKITIQGQDYTLALDAAHPLTITRRFNERSVCRFWLSLPADGSLVPPTRNQPVAVQGDNGTKYFSGYLAVSPLPEYAGLTFQGPRSRIVVEALSDDFLQETATVDTSNRASSSAIPGTVHMLDEAYGTLDLSQLALTAMERRSLANDITVCGQREPVAYVTEYFLGDGATMQFYLAEDPYLPPSAQQTLIRELFNESTIDPRRWANSGGTGYLMLGGGGLSMNGGRGTDGDTMLMWLDPVEMGGTLMLEAAGVSLAAGSTGILPGFFTGPMTLAGCTAGFQATSASGNGAVTLQPVMLGTPTGSAFAINSANQYTLRIRVHCPEAYRSLATYQSYDGASVSSYGGSWNGAPAKLLFEIQEFVDGVASMPVVLLDGALDSLPGFCSIAAVSSLNLQGSMRSLSLYDLGSGWVTTALGSGNPESRRVGSEVHSAECQVERSGKVVFFTGFTPTAGTQIAVSYRTAGRAVGRAINSASQAELTTAGLPPVSPWIGTVKSPEARCSQDCRNAAQALADATASAGALWKGVYKTLNVNLDTDVQPGDVLTLNASSLGMDVQAIVRSVQLSYRASYPDLIEYAIDFANDWAGNLAIETSETVPDDVWAPAVAGLTPLANLNAMAVTSLSGSTVTVNTGTMPPVDGGFEVRRRDFAFKPGEDAGLVMRSATSTISFTRVAASDRFYIRMYDGSTPPNYSEFSAALFFNLPLGS